MYYKEAREVFTDTSTLFSAKIWAVTLGSNFTARIFLISGGLAGGQGSQGTT